MTDRGRQVCADYHALAAQDWRDALLLALIGGTVVFGYLGTRTFTKRVLN